MDSLAPPRSPGSPTDDYVRSETESQGTLEQHDFARVLAAWRGHPRLMLGTLAIALGIAALWIHFAVPLFEAKATVAIDPRRPLVLQNTAVLANLTTDSASIDTQPQLLKSRAVLSRAAATLSKAGAFTRAPFRGAGRSAQIALLADALKVQRAGLTSTLELTFTADDPAFAAAVVNAIAASYIEYQQALKAEATQDANRWLHQQIDASQPLLNEVSTATNRYRIQSGLIDSESSESLSVEEQTNIDKAARDSALARSRLVAAEDAQRLQGTTAAAQVIDTQAMQQLRTKYASMAQHKAQLAATLGMQHPQLMEVDQQLTALRSQINGEVQRSIEELRSQVTFAENRLAASQRNSALLQSQLSRENQARVHYNDLAARADPMHKMYESLLNRLQQTVAQQSLDQINAAIVSAAPIPTRVSSPNQPLILSATLALSFGIASLAAFLLDVFDSRVWRQADFERRTRVPVIAAVPELRRADLRIAGARITIEDLVPADPNGKFADTFRRARVALPAARVRDDGMVVQFTSASFGEGKTTCALAFAQTAAADGHRAIIIDADTRRASLTRLLDLSPEVGLLEVLAGKVTLDSAVTFNRSMHLYALALSKYDLPSRDFLSSYRLDSLFEQLRERFDLVIVDTPPVLGVADALSIASRVDTVVIAARWATTDVSLVDEAIEAVRRVNGNIGGVAFTRVATGRVAQTVGMDALNPAFRG